jgi:hypothetical protein
LAGTTGLPFEIAGVQELGQTPDARMIDGKTLTWVREDAANRPMIDWRVPVPSRPQQEVQYRDAIILDSNNEFAAVQNLTDQPLTVAANRQAFTELLVQATTAVDSDADGLPDGWESDVFGDLAAGPETACPSGVPALLAYAFGQDPQLLSAGDAPLRAVEVVPGPGGLHLSLTFRARLGLEGGQLHYAPAASSDGQSWSTDPVGWVEVGRIDPYDGSGCELVTVRTAEPVPVGGGAVRLARVEISPQR